MGEGEKNEWGTDSGERLRERDCLACGEKQVARTRKNSHRYDADRGEKAPLIMAAHSVRKKFIQKTHS